MQCPFCDGKLQEGKINYNNVNVCSSCNGFWVNKNLVPSILDHYSTLKLQGKQFLSCSPEENSIYNGMIGGFCPECNTALEKEYLEFAPVTTHECSQGHGIWLRFKQMGNMLDGWQYYENKYNFSLNAANPYIRKEKESNLGFDTSAGGCLKALFGIVQDDTPKLHPPVITYSLIALNVIFFIVSLFYFEYWQYLMFYPSNFFSEPVQNFHSIFTSMFMHGDIFHIFGNMLFLYIFGDNLEDRIGKPKFISFYLISGIVATLGFGIINFDSAIPVLGASGAISGIMGGYLVLYPKAKLTFYTLFFFMPVKFRLPVWFYVGIFFVLQQFIGIYAAAEGVAWFAHLAGFISGVIMMLILKFTDNL